MSERFDVGRRRSRAGRRGGRRRRSAGTLASRSATRAALVVGGGRAPSRGVGAVDRRRRAGCASGCAPATSMRGPAGGSSGAPLGDERPGGATPAAPQRSTVPVVLAVCGPREPWVEPLLDDAAIVLVAGEADDPLTALALAALDARGLAAAAVAAPAGVGAVLARIGLGAPSAWRAALPVAPGRRRDALDAGDRGQALLLLLGGLLIVVAGGLALGWVAAGVSAHGARQRAADLGGARDGARARRPAPARARAAALAALPGARRRTSRSRAPSVAHRCAQRRAPRRRAASRPARCRSARR